LPQNEKVTHAPANRVDVHRQQHKQVTYRRQGTTGQSLPPPLVAGILGHALHTLYSGRLIHVHGSEQAKP
jgi:hypothetical protein